MTRGEPAGPVGPVEGAYRPPPDDTGEAIGLPAVRADAHVRVRPDPVPRRRGRDRFGLADRRPAALRTLPHFPADNLDPARSDGDLCVQACADDPQVAVHAIRNLARIGFGTVAVRWSQLGLRPDVVDVDHARRRRATCSASRTAPRTSRPRRPTALDEHVWVAAGDDPTRRLAGRRLLPGRPPDQHDHRDLGPPAARRAGGRSSAAPRPRVRRCRAATSSPSPTSRMPGRDGPGHRRATPTSGSCTPTTNDGARMLRRGYNFVDGSDALGGLDAGLFFLAYVRDPAPTSSRCRPGWPQQDALMEYLKFTGSAPVRRPARHRAGGVRRPVALRLSRHRSSDVRAAASSRSVRGRTGAAFAGRAGAGVRRREGCRAQRRAARRRDPAAIAPPDSRPRIRGLRSQ